MNDKIRRYFYSLMTDEVRGPAACVLKPILSFFSFLYLCASSAAYLFYEKGIFKNYRPKCRVVSIGNITLGGTGKTPLTVAIARYLRSREKKTVVLTRGYMKSGASGIADEAELFKRCLKDTPVIAGRDRILSAREAEDKYAPDAILLDDGFQHWRLRRDIDIVTVPVNNPFGNERLIPRGILREPISALSRADIVVVTKVFPEGTGPDKAKALERRIKDINPAVEIFNASYYPEYLYDVTEDHKAEIGIIDNKPVALLCAIGDPSSFEDTVVSLGAKIAAAYYFMDHHIFSAGEIDKVVKECKQKDIDTIITTEKDLPRIQGTGCRIQGTGINIFALGIEMKISNEGKFFDRLDSLFAGKA